MGFLCSVDPHSVRGLPTVAMLAAIWGKKLNMLFFCNGGNMYTVWCRKTNTSFFTGTVLSFGNGGHVGGHFG